MFRTALLMTITLLAGFTLINCSRAPEKYAELRGETDAFEPLPQKTERNEICGIEQYNARSHELCGVAAWRGDRSAACGVELYNARNDLACPGSLSFDQYERVTRGACRDAAASPEACAGGYDQTRHVKETTSCCIGRQCDNVEDIVTYQRRECRRNESLNTCRLEQFGVERYNSCRHPSHGAESYNSCRRSEFGVESYKQCSFYLLPGEVNRHLAAIKESLPYMGEAMINNKGFYYNVVEDEPASACHIAKYEHDPIFDAQISELKAKYLVDFGRSYQPSTYDCTQPVTNTIDTESCSDSDTSRKCKHVRSYRGARKWLDAKASDLEHLKTDIAARQNAALLGVITSQANDVEKYRN